MDATAIGNGALHSNGAGADTKGKPIKCKGEN
jgi:hypothetical protein